MLPAQKIYYHGIIATADKSFRMAQAVAVLNGRILAVGTDEEILALRGKDTECEDLQGALLLPGMHDSHVHASDYIHNLHHLSCDHMQSIHDLQAALRIRRTELLSQQAELHTQHDVWLLGNGLPQSLLDAGLDRRALDSSVSDIPVILIDWHGHGCVANSAALRLSGIDRNTADPAGGIIRRDVQGEPTGILDEAGALQYVFRGMRSFTPEEIIGRLTEMQGLMNRMGYTAYTECTAGPANNAREGGASGEACLEAYRLLLRRGLLTCRVSVGFYSGRDGFQSYELLKDALERGLIPMTEKPEWLRFHMLKFFCDGVDVAHTAWMKQDYANAPGCRGSSCFCAPGASEEEQVSELRRVLRLAHDSGYQIGIHTVGDRAVKEALDAIIAAQTANPLPDCRHYLIHADIMGDPEDLLKCSKHGILISSQPNLAESLFDGAENLIGAAKASRLLALRTLLDGGVLLAGGSDSIAGDYHDWRQGIYYAVERRSAATGRQHHPELSATVQEAVRMYTINAAYQEFSDKERGSVETGKLADFTIVDRNFLCLPIEEIKKVQVLQTVVGGKTVYRA